MSVLWKSASLLINTVIEADSASAPITGFLTFNSYCNLRGQDPFTITRSIRKSLVLVFIVPTCRVATARGKEGT